MPRRDLLELVDDLHGPHFRRAGDGAGREAGGQRIDKIVLGIELAHHVRDDVHDVRVVLEEELVGNLDATDLGDAADIVAAEVEQHQVLGQFLGIARAARRPVPCRASASSRACGCRRWAGW